MQYEGEHWPIVLTQERVSFVDSDTGLFQKTLRIYDKERNLDLIKAILLETIPESDVEESEFKECPPSIQVFRDSIYYFKRIFK